MCTMYNSWWSPPQSQKVRLNQCDRNSCMQKLIEVPPYIFYKLLTKFGVEALRALLLCPPFLNDNQPEVVMC